MADAAGRLNDATSHRVSLPAISMPTAIALIVLLAAHAAIAWHSLRIKSVTYDEVSHLPAGLAMVATGDIELNRQHPPLVKWLAGWAASTTEPTLPLDGAAYRDGDEWAFGLDVLFEQGNDHWSLLRRARLPTVALSTLAGLLVFLWSRRRFGDAGALLSTGLWAFSPTLLAHARWVTMDAAITTFVLATLYFWWRLLAPGHDQGQRRAWPLVACVVALGLALASKFSALVLLPALVALDLLARQGQDQIWRRRVADWLTLLGGAFIVLWLCYRCPFDLLFYWRDVGQLYADLPEGYTFYLAGEFQQRFAHYFLATFALKSTPIELLVTALVILLVVHRAWRRRWQWGDDLFLWLPAALWFVVTSALASNQGHRYLLPIYPLLFILAGGLVPVLRRSVARSWLVPAVILVLVAAQAGGALSHHPDYLPYFNAMAGGSAAAPRWLDDSNVDWNQDIGRLAPWLERQGIGSARLAYLGYSDPEFYGVERQPFLASDWRDGPRPGAYVMSAHVLARGLEAHRRDGFASNWLERYEPQSVLGDSLYLYVFPPSDAPPDRVPPDRAPPPDSSPMR